MKTFLYDKHEIYASFYFTKNQYYPQMIGIDWLIGIDFNSYLMIIVDNFIIDNFIDYSKLSKNNML